MTPPDGSITVWLSGLVEGDQEAAKVLWDRFFERMVRFARSRLDSDGHPKGEEEDVALSAFHEFFLAAADDRFARLANRNDVWQVLHLLVSRKTVDYYRRSRRQKRDGPTVPMMGDDVAATGEDPALTASILDEVRVLFDRLTAPGLRRIAVLKLDGYTNEEISRQLGCTLRTVERRIGLIRSLWSPVNT